MEGSKNFKATDIEDCKQFPKDERFLLVPQIKDSSRSVTANIAEGYGRYNYQETSQSFRQARGSLNETLDHLTSALDEEYLSKETFVQRELQYEKVLKLINGYIAFLQRAKQDQSTKPITQYPKYLNAFMTQNLIQYILHLADNALILAQRNSEWCGHGPVLEQDIAITNITLDLIGQARNFYQYAAQTIKGSKLPSSLGEMGGEVNEDTLAYLRDNRDFKNCLLVEQTNGALWGKTILRQFFF